MPNTTSTSLIPIDKPMLIDDTELKPFEPTPHMIVFLDTAVRLMSDNISEIAEECNMTRNNWYGWNKISGFNEWWLETWDEKLANVRWKLDAIGFKNAKREFKYWEAMQKMGGRLGEDSTPVQINHYTNLTDEQLDKIIDAKTKQTKQTDPIGPISGEGETA